MDRSSIPANRFLSFIQVNYFLQEKYLKQMMKKIKQPIKFVVGSTWNYSGMGRWRSSFKERSYRYFLYPCIPGL